MATAMVTTPTSRVRTVDAFHKNGIPALAQLVPAPPDGGRR
jgi:hypothetical protein